jgi:hypothetical protein
MGKSDDKQTKEGAHKATDTESKHKNQPSFNYFGNAPIARTSKANDAALRRHSQWCDNFRQFCEYKVQFGHCLVPKEYSANPKLSNWVMTQRQYYKMHQEGKPTTMTAFHIRELQSSGFE